jgi:chemotaxis protein MotA
VDLATLIGILGAVGIVGSAIALGGDPVMFVNAPSILIVLGGSIFVVMMKFGLGQFLGAVKIAAKAFIFKLDEPAALITRIVELADIARKGGLLSLEDQEVDNKFLKGGIQLLIDGHDPDIIKSMLTKDMNLAINRHEIGQKIFMALADVAPAMGMIGTLVGLVQMLANMDDPKSIGPAMAVALLTTLYGAMIATMVASPIADKLALRRGDEGRVKSLCIDALLAIQGGQNPRVIESMLRTYLPETKREAETEGEPEKA